MIEIAVDLIENPGEVMADDIRTGLFDLQPPMFVAVAKAAAFHKTRGKLFECRDPVIIVAGAAGQESP